MFEYKGCKGEKMHGLWFITLADGTKDAAVHLSVALMICRGEL